MLHRRSSLFNKVRFVWFVNSGRIKKYINKLTAADSQFRSSLRYPNKA